MSHLKRGGFGIHRDKFPPTKCLCGKKLPEPQHGRLPVQTGWATVDISWFVPCSCGMFASWQFPNVWLWRGAGLFDLRQEVSERT